MYKKIVKQIERQIAENVGKKTFLKDVGFHKRDAQVLVKKHIPNASISDVIMGDDFSGSRILKLCLPMMAVLCPAEPEEGWLNYSYHLAIKDMFEESVDIDPRPEAKIAARFYLEVLAAFLVMLPQMGKVRPGYWFEFATEEEIEGEAAAAEYRAFLESFRRDKVYEMMWIGAETTRFDALGHVGGVHYIAMHAARQLKKLGVPVDLGLISGAAAGHDIGKYGCHGEEVKRIPYLHYYYTDQWFKRHRVPNIGHVAANHSTWDLELENLSVENLLLIYADFRVKSVSRDEQGKEIVTYFSLKDAFDVILSKLDNVDQAKENRYRKVYAKLKDFEDYMVSLGVETDLKTMEPKPVVHPDPAILSADDTVQLLKNMAVDHNIRLMHVIQSDASLATVQEAARSEKNWKNSRAYISVFEEYFMYMTRRQKALTLNFLYEHMMHKEGDVRRQAAALMGKIIVNFDDDYRKELPKHAVRETESAGLKLWEKYLTMMFTPDHKIIEKHRRWLGFALKTVVETVLAQCKPQDRNAYLKKLLAHYRTGDYDDVTAFMLLDTMMVVPLIELDGEERMALLQFVNELNGRESMEIRAGILRFLQKFDAGVKMKDEEARLIDRTLSGLKIWDDVALLYVKKQLLSSGGVREFWHSSSAQDVVTDIFLKNMKIATPWTIKEINIQMLLDYLKEEPEANVLQVAAHLSNLLKVSERITVRHTAGRALLETAPLLTKDQRNEIAIELNKGLETGEYEFSKYIPEYLGQFVLWLHPLELDEFLRDLKKFLVSVNDRVVCVALDTLGVMVKHYRDYRNRFEEEESEEAYRERAKLMIGLLLGGLANYRQSVSQEAFLVIGQELFADGRLSEEEKLALFQLTYKKIVTTVPEREKGQLAFFNNAASLNHIYRFINDYLFSYGKFDIREPEKVAFFPGTFDPFSLSHKGIATELRDMGFIVYLALDEFSWSKKTQPRMIRKQIMEMTVAGEENIYIFPDDLPVNIANPDNLRKLRELFPGKELYLAVGADVVKNASSYKADPGPWSVQTMNHVIFQRFGVEMDYESAISGKVMVLNLPEQLMDISSTKIRDNVDRNRDISNLVDPVVQNYIYENNLYLREPEFKPVLQSRSVRLEVRKRCTAEVRTLLSEHISRWYEEKKDLESIMERSGAVLLWDHRGGERLLGAVIFRGLTTSELYEEFKNTAVVDHIRDNTSGKIILIQGLYRFGKSDVKERGQLMLTEAIAHALSRDFTYCVFSPRFHPADEKTVELLQRQGFVALKEAAAGRPVFAVDMKQPVVVFKNIATSLKAPFNEAPRVVEAIDKAHHRLQSVMTQLYPGNLVLSFHASVMHSRMVELITKANEVPVEPLPVRKLGKNMCVPFGKILRGVAIPNTVTKTLHTEKVMSTDLKSFVITKYPNYSPLQNQIRTIRAFNRDVILVDDLLHKGHRMRALDPLFKAEELPIDRLVVGLLSGRGKDLMDIQKRKVESVYYLPNLKAWVIESSIYPFIGGDTVDRPVKMRANLLNSANLILPYAIPSFVGDAPKAAIYNLSRTCLENARDVLEALEREYQERYERKLTLNRLSEVVIFPCCTDWGDCLTYDYHLAPSSYVKDDLERLVRLEGLLRG
ncbi:MAG: hypothetical protein IJ486_10800 [Firmicutes bacterium]|nr:hypothetical protein [Bacillota bacterium]